MGVLQLAYGRLPSEPHARPWVQGGCATQRQNHEGTVTVPLRIVPQEELAAEADVLPLRACCSSLRFLRRGAQTTRTGRSCFLWTGQPDPRDRTL